MAIPRSLSFVIIMGIIFLIIFICFIIPKQNEQKGSKEKTERSPLTKEKLRKYRGLQNITDKEAENIIYSLRKYSELTYRLFREEKTNGIIL